MEVSRAKTYREVLRGLYDAKKKSNPRFSFRQFASLAGFKSPNYLQLILDGRRNLRTDTAALIASRFKLTAAEREYFVALVKIEIAVTAVERDQAERMRLAALKKILAKDISSAHKEIFGRWYYLAVRELFFIRGARAEPEWICARLNGLISRTEAVNAITLLVRCGLLVPTAEGYQPHDPVLDTDDQQLQAAMMRDFHADLLRQWSAHLGELSPREQELGVVNIPIHSSRVPELRRRIRQFQDEIIGWVQEDREADRVVQLGTYLIPFSGEE